MEKWQISDPYFFFAVGLFDYGRSNRSNFWFIARYESPVAESLDGELCIYDMYQYLACNKFKDDRTTGREIMAVFVFA